MKMKWIEVIKISVAENRRAALEKKIRSIMSNLGADANTRTAKLYRNLLDGDWCIRLSWDRGRAQPRGSKTGLCLAQVLREFGLISHSVWVEK
jgi:hypothetical protein